MRPTDHKSRKRPAWLKAPVRPGWALFVLAIVLQAAALLVAAFFPLMPFVTGALLLISIPLLFLGFAVFRTDAKRRGRRVIEAGGRVCIHCGFDLAGLEDRGKCPECGADYDIAESVRRCN
jgi:hypothetical protein